MSDAELARALRDFCKVAASVISDMRDVLQGHAPDAARERLRRSAPIAISAARAIALRSLDYRALGQDASIIADRLEEAVIADWSDGALFASVQGRFRPFEEAAVELGRLLGNKDER